MDQLKKVLSILDNRKKKLTLLLPFFLSLSFIEIVSISILTIYITKITGQNIDALNINIVYLKQIIDDTAKLTYLVIIIFLGKFLYTVFINFLISRFSLNEKRVVQSFLLQKYIQMSYFNFKFKTLPEINETIQRRVGHYINSINVFLKLLNDSLLLFLLLIYLVKINIHSFLILLIVTSLFIFFYYLLISKKIINYGKKSTKASKNIFKTVQDTFKSFKEIKFLGKEKFFTNNFKIYTTKEYISFLKLNFLNSLIKPLFELIIIFIFLFLIYILPKYKIDTEQLTSILIAFGIAALRLMPTASQIIRSFNLINFNKFSVDYVFKEINGENTKIENTNAKIYSIDNNEKKLINFKNVTYSYDSDKIILENINFDLFAKDKIFITGASGSGKSTFLDILSGLLTPTNGEIYINNNLLKINSFNQLKEKIGYVAQQSFYLDDTVETNVALKDAKSLTYDEKLKINNLKGISLIDFNVVFRNGSFSDLSGGQKQRISIARNLFSEKEILIFDESTSNIDHENEKMIIKNILNYFNNKTIIFVSHNKNLIKYFDKIYRFENKKIK